MQPEIHVVQICVGLNPPPKLECCATRKPVWMLSIPKLFQGFHQGLFARCRSFIKRTCLTSHSSTSSTAAHPAGCRASSVERCAHVRRLVACARRRASRVCHLCACTLFSRTGRTSLSTFAQAATVFVWSYFSNIRLRVVYQQ